MLYVSIQEKKLFKKYAKREYTSMSKWIKNAALMHVNTLNSLQPVNAINDDNTALVDGLKSQIAELKFEIIELKTPPQRAQGIQDRMSERIFEYLKKSSKWITEQELHDICNIENQEQHDDFTVAMHQLQFHHNHELEYNGRYGWRIKK